MSFCSRQAKYHHSALANGGTCLARNEPELIHWLATRHSSERWRRGLAPHFASAFDSAAESCKRNTSLVKAAALLLSGGLRTGTSPAGLREVAASLQSMRQHASSVEAFAYIGPDDGYKEKHHMPCFRATVSDRRRRAASASLRVREQASEKGPCAEQADDRNISLRLDAFRAVFAAAGVPLEIELHSDDSALMPDLSAAGCPSDHKGGPNKEQFLKVEAATEMMRRAERLRGVQFGFVVRLRPDLCGGAVFAGLAARMLSCTSPYPLIAYDLAAAYPRFLADAYASQWRVGCAVPPGWSTANACNGAIRTANAAVPAAGMMRWVAGAPSLEVSGGGFNISDHPGLFAIGIRRPGDRCARMDMSRRCVLPSA